MKSSAEFLKDLFSFLNQKGEYAVLRNFEGLPEKNNSRDIDIIIEKSTYKKIKTDLVSLVEAAGWKIITFLNSDRLITWVCGNVNDNKITELVQLDFFFHTSVFGIHLLEANEILQHRQFNGQIYHVDKDYEFLDKYLYDRAVGVSYPQKYATTKEAVSDSPEVRRILQRTFKADSINECDKLPKCKLLRNAFMQHPLSSMIHFMEFQGYYLKNYLCSNTGFSIGFTGPDGSGKTTVIDLLIEQLGDVFRKAHAYYHFRPALFGNLGEVAHSAGIKKEVDRNYDVPHRGGKTGKLNSLIRLAYYSVDYILGYFKKVKTQTRITRLVIFDRYFTDIICDSRRSRIYLNPKFLYWFGRLFIPSLDYNILLTASTETILGRKQELDREGIEAINKKIDYLSVKKGYKKVTNERSPEDAVQEILKYIFDRQHIKNIKRLQG